MRILPIHVIPIFLSSTLPGSVGSQLRMFDVFYTKPPVVGWHVMGSDQEVCEVVGFSVQGEPPLAGGVGFTVSGPSPQQGVMGFCVEGEEPYSGSVGFTVESEEHVPEGVVGFSSEEEENYNATVGFIVGDTDDNA